MIDSLEKQRPPGVVVVSSLVNVLLSLIFFGVCVMLLFFFFFLEMCAVDVVFVPFLLSLCFCLSLSLCLSVSVWCCVFLCVLVCSCVLWCVCVCVVCVVCCVVVVLVFFVCVVVLVLAGGFGPPGFFFWCERREEGEGCWAEEPVEFCAATFVCTHWQCWFCVSSALVVRSAILRFFSHGVLFVKFLCAPVSVCLKGP